MRQCAHSQSKKVVSVGSTGRGAVRVALLDQLGPGVVMDGFEQPVTDPAGDVVSLDEALVDQGVNQVENLELLDLSARAHRLGGGKVEAAREHREAGDRGLLGGRQQVIGPVHQRSQRLLARQGGT